MDVIVVGLFFLGLGLLVAGAELLVSGAARLAAVAGVSPLVIGLTVVAFGTSAPEMAVSVRASWLGQADLAVGNVVGSNVFNVLLIVGASAVITPLVVAQQLVRRDVPLMIAVSAATLLLALDGSVGRLDGVFLVAGLVAYTVWAVRQSRRELRDVQQEYAAAMPAAARRPWIRDSFLVLAGLVLLVLGSHWLVQGAVQFARWAGVSDVVVGLTIVAAGTSLPELATSVFAAIRGQRDIAVGNVVGSNLFNLMGVLGVSGAIVPSGLPVAPAMLQFDLPVMIACAVACLPIFTPGNVIARWQGGLFLAAYVAFTVYLVLDATGHGALEGYRWAMLTFVLPLLGLTLAITAVRTWRRP